MNDPHVVALVYKLRTRETVSFKDPPTLTFDRSEFSGELRDGDLTVEMKTHYAEVQQARVVVDEFLDGWTLHAALSSHRRDMWFEFERADTIDRTPSPSVHGVALLGIPSLQACGTATVSVTRTSYPRPPDAFVVTPMVRRLWDRYEASIDGREPAPSAGYFCETALMTLAPPTVNKKADRQAWVAQHLFVDVDVLDFLNYVTNKGYAYGRKYNPHPIEHVGAEINWIRMAIRALTRRVGEKAGAPGAALPTITFGDLPALSDDLLAPWRESRARQRAQRK